MESNLKRVIGDLNKSRGLGETGSNGSSSNSGSGGEGANPIAKVRRVFLWQLACFVFELLFALKLYISDEFTPFSLLCADRGGAEQPPREPRLARREVKVNNNKLSSLLACYLLSSLSVAQFLPPSLICGIFFCVLFAGKCTARSRW